MARVFVSYAREDQSAARRVVDALAREGLEAWWDHEIPPGRTWAQVIGERVSEADVILVLWSDASVGSDFVQEEAQMALEARKLLPVRLDFAQPPMGFRRMQAADLSDWDGEHDHRQWRMLVNEVRTRLGMTATPLPARADESEARPRARSAAPEPAPAASTAPKLTIGGVVAVFFLWFLLNYFVLAPNYLASADAQAEFVSGCAGSDGLTTQQRCACEWRILRHDPQMRMALTIQSSTLGLAGRDRFENIVRRHLLDGAYQQCRR